MFNLYPDAIKPKTYNDALRLSRCMALKRYVPSLTDDMIENMYNYLSANPVNLIGVSSGLIYYIDASGAKTEAYTVETASGFDQIIIGTASFRVTNTTTDSGCSGCGGCSCNNNNNNNNNNG